MCLGPLPKDITDSFRQRVTGDTASLDSFEWGQIICKGIETIEHRAGDFIDFEEEIGPYLSWSVETINKCKDKYEDAYIYVNLIKLRNFKVLVTGNFQCLNTESNLWWLVVLRDFQKN